MSAFEVGSQGVGDGEQSGLDDVLGKAEEVAAVLFKGEVHRRKYGS
jgi:hypothetical protein